MRVNLSVVKPIDAWKVQMEYAKKNYKADALAAEREKVIQDIKSYKELLDKSVAKALEEIDSELAELKRPLPIQQRNLKPDEITQLNYQSKILLSRLQGEATNHDEFIAVLQDAVERGDRQTRWALADSIHEVLATAKGKFGYTGSTQSSSSGMSNAELAAHRENYFDGAERPAQTAQAGAVQSAAWLKLESRIREQHQAVLDSLKTPDELATAQEYKEKKSQLEKERLSIVMGSSNAQTYLSNELGRYQGSAYFEPAEKPVLF